MIACLLIALFISLSINVSAANAQKEEYYDPPHNTDIVSTYTLPAVTEWTFANVNLEPETTTFLVTEDVSSDTTYEDTDESVSTSVIDEEISTVDESTDSSSTESEDIISTTEYSNYIIEETYSESWYDSRSALTDIQIDEARMRATLEIVAPNLVGIESDLVQIQNETGLKASVLLGIFGIESGYGVSELAQYKNNLAGWNAYPTSTLTVFENASYFETQNECVQTVGGVLNRYYINGCGATTLYEIASIYCPGNAGEWSLKVGQFMERIETAYNSI